MHSAPWARTIATSRRLLTSRTLNPYRTWEHGCIYCFARPMHEYLRFSQGLDFETQILVKEEALELLRRELASKQSRPPLPVEVTALPLS